MPLLLSCAPQSKSKYYWSLQLALSWKLQMILMAVWPYFLMYISAAFQYINRMYSINGSIGYGGGSCVGLIQSLYLTATYRPGIGQLQHKATEIRRLKRWGQLWIHLCRPLRNLFLLCQLFWTLMQSQTIPAIMLRYHAPRRYLPSLMSVNCVVVSHLLNVAYIGGRGITDSGTMNVSPIR
jgi:hypothetical protein